MSVVLTYVYCVTSEIEPSCSPFLLLKLKKIIIYTKCGVV